MAKAIRPAVAPGDVGPGQDRDGHQGRGGAALDVPEGDEQGGPGGERAEAEGVGEAVLAGPGQAEDQREQAGGHAHRAGQVHPGPLGGTALLQHHGRGDDHGQRDGHVDEERPPPAQQLGQQPAEDRARGEPGRHQRAVQAERPGPQRPLGERRGQQREPGGRDDGRGQALGDPGDQQHARRDGQAAGQRGDTQQHHAGQEQPAPPQQVGDPAEQQREPGGGQRERRGHPLEVGQREAET